MLKKLKALLTPMQQPKARSNDAELVGHAMNGKYYIEADSLLRNLELVEQGRIDAGRFREWVTQVRNKRAS